MFGFPSSHLSPDKTLFFLQSSTDFFLILFLHKNMCEENLLEAANTAFSCFPNMKNRLSSKSSPVWEVI